MSFFSMSIVNFKLEMYAFFHSWEEKETIREVKSREREVVIEWTQKAALEAEGELQREHGSIGV